MSVNEREKTAELLKQLARGRAVMVVEHDMQFVESIADTVTVLHQGKLLAEGKMAHVKNDPKVVVLLQNIREHIPTEAVIFDVSTDRGIRSGSQSLTEIMYRLFLQRLGYSRDLDLAELEITLEAQDRLAAFVDTYRSLFDKEWDRNKNLFAT